jgi:hypothetical protein
MKGRFADALSSLNGIRRIEANEDVAGLSDVMLQACARAIEWKADADPYTLLRAEDQQFLESGVPSLLAAVTKLQALSEKHHRGFDSVVWRAVKEVGITPDMMREAGYDGATGNQGGPFIRALLAALHGRLEAERAGDTRIAIKGKNTGGVHRHVYGPLLFPVKVDTARMPDPRITGLQFELAFYLRRYTAGRRLRRITFDDVVPTCGKPHYDIIAEFTSAALDHFPTDNGEAFKKAMKTNTSEDGKPVRWWGWAAPEGHAATAEIIVYGGFDPDD